MSRGASNTKRGRNYRQCQACRGGLERIQPADDGRPRFQCTGCRRPFTCGRDGGEYARVMPEALVTSSEEHAKRRCSDEQNR